MKTEKTHDERIFFGKWLRDPLRMGTFLPSGPWLCRAVAAAAAACPKEGAVIELGGGTGAVTKALLAAGIPPEDLTVIEREKGLYDVLAARYPELKVIHGDALQVKSLVGDIGPVKAIVSGLPLLNIAPKSQKILLKACFELLGHDGIFVQFTYGPASPVPERRLKRLGLVPRLYARVWRNVPPASVWVFSHRGVPAMEKPRAAVMGESAPLHPGI